MRKNLLLASLACIGGWGTISTLKAQNVSDFENLTLPANSYWNGADYSGTHVNGAFYSTFNSGDAVFPNVYDTAWGAPGFWSEGFAYSNVVDSVTSGLGNMYAAKAASGFGNSTNYVVAQNNTVIHLTGTAKNNTVKGFYVTNSTYAANSMRDGDAFAKKFGGASGNDADWFLLTVKGYINGNLTNDSVNFYLADYRFSNNAQDYIVKNWQWVDLTSLGAVDSLMFTLNSSDVGQWGMNTPAFFCIDNFNDQSVGFQNNTTDNKIQFYPNPTDNQIHFISDETLNNVNLIGITGETMDIPTNYLFGNNTIDMSSFPAGIYFLSYTINQQLYTTKIIKK